MDTSTTCYNFKERKSQITHNLEINNPAPTSRYEFKSRKQEINNKMIFQNLTEFPMLNLNTEHKYGCPAPSLCYDKLKITLNKNESFVEKAMQSKKHRFTLPLPPKLTPKFIKESYDWSNSQYYITYPVIDL